MKFEKTEIFNIEAAIRGMRNPLNSWDRSDSGWKTDSAVGFKIGENDLNLMQKLIKAGHPHRKFLRQILISVDITAPLYWWKEFDTYKVGVTRNSCSTMHTLHVHPFDPDMFSHDAIDKVSMAAHTFSDLLNTLETLRNLYSKTQDKFYWRAMIQLFPEGFNMKATISMNYENVLNMIQYREGHKLKEWSDDFMFWARTLPYADELLFVRDK